LENVAKFYERLGKNERSGEAAKEVGMGNPAEKTTFT
jgi:hypothetical protein